ncbi:hypothetical protein Tco_0607213, partial [Tanacetum coccineum]
MEVEEEVVGMTQKRQRLLKFLRDLLVVKEEVENQVVFYVIPDSFSSFSLLQPSQTGVGL